VSTYHLKHSDLKTLYLDIIHELYHLKQFLQGKQLFNNELSYVDNPIEIEAYRFTVEEAKRIGLTKEEIIEYLKVDWIDEEEHKRLIKQLGLE
ncbi:MAG: hypothetical protein ACK4TI_02490, partial [Nitrososphaerales archaeon]